MKTTSLNLKIFVGLLCSLFLAETIWAQRESPLIYTDPEFGWKDNRDPDSPRVSPTSIVGIQLGSTRVMVTYGSPGVKGRKIFGDLVPFGAVWRTGADEATTITFSDDVVVQGHPVAAGTYSLFTIPEKTEWTVILNKENNQWGAYRYNKSMDLLNVKVPSQHSAHQERLAFRFEDIQAESASAVLTIHWAEITVRFKIEEA
ncbi:DUF2911 domain-containing protein [bacterium]|nr:DUF2911 domain-containing protein [bacterium]